MEELISQSAHQPHDDHAGTSASGRSDEYPSGIISQIAPASQNWADLTSHGVVRRTSCMAKPHDVAVEAAETAWPAPGRIEPMRPSDDDSERGNLIVVGRQTVKITARSPTWQAPGDGRRGEERPAYCDEVWARFAFLVRHLPTIHAFCSLADASRLSPLCQYGVRRFVSVN